MEVVFNVDFINLFKCIFMQFYMAIVHQTLDPPFYDVNKSTWNV